MSVRIQEAMSMMVLVLFSEASTSRVRAWADLSETFWQRPPPRLPWTKLFSRRRQWRSLHGRSRQTPLCISSRANGILSTAQRELILGTQLADLMVRFPEVVADTELQKSRRKVGSDGAVCGAYSRALRALAELERHLAARPTVSGDISTSRRTVVEHSSIPWR